MKKIYNLKIGFVTALIFTVLTSAFGQSPGGVSADLAAWYKGDVGLAGTFWADQSGNAYNLERTSAPVGESLINFNPVASFGGVTAHQFNNLTPKLLWPVGNTATTYYYVAKNNAATTNRGVLGIGQSALSGNTGFHSGQAPLGIIASGGRHEFPTSSDRTARVVAPPDWNITESNQGLNLVRTGFNGGANQKYYITAQGSPTEGVTVDDLSPSYGNSEPFRIGATGTNDNFWNGEVAEVVVFSGKHDPAEYNKIETYLALKYGISKQGDYVDANDNVLYSDATYNNNISGIGRDDASGLHQKQAMSQNTGSQLLIGNGSSLFDTNAGNINDLADGQFLVWGDNGLQKQLAESLTHNAPGGETNFRFGAIWKAQNTNGVGQVTVAWPAGITNLHLVQSADAVFDNTDTFTPMTSVVTVNGIDYNTATVTLSNGAYFTFAGFAQGPGGVLANLLMWHKADDGVTTPGQKSIWQDISQNDRDVTQNDDAARQPSLILDAHYSADSRDYFFNFNPFYYFDGGDVFYRANDGYFSASNSPGSIYNIIVNGGTGTRTAFSFSQNDNRPSLTRVGDNYRAYSANTTFTAAPAGYSATTMPAHIGSISWIGSAPGISPGINGHTSAGNVSININMNGPFSIGSQGSNPSEAHLGGSAEVFAYDVDHQNSGGDEQQRINSYLAVKYGITLSNNDGTGVPDYLSSASEIVWNATANVDYNNNILGIAQDFPSALYQKQSTSVNENQKLIIGAGSSLFDTNADNTNTLSDGQFLIVGDNGLKQALSEPLVYTAGANGETNFRFESIWKVQNTANVGTVTVAWPVGIQNLYLVQSTDEIFDNTDTFAPMDNIVTINGEDYNTATVTLADGAYFTLAGYMMAPGGVAGQGFWVRSDMAGDIATAWQDHSTNADDIPALGAWALSDADGAHNFHPYTTDYTTSKNFYNPNNMLNPGGGDNTTSYSMFSSVRPTSTGTGRITGMGTTGGTTYGSNPSLASSAGTPRFYDFDATTTSEVFSTPFTLNATNLFSAVADNSIANGGGSSFSGGELTLGLNGTYEGFTYNNSNLFQFNGPYLRVGYSTFGTGAGVFPGDIMEVIWYSRALTANEQSRVNSYLAIKNGVTLNEDYLNSDSDVVFSQSTNSGYTENIFGLGFNAVSGLTQRQSRSINEGQELIIGAGSSLFDNNAGNTNDLTEGQFLLVGDNGLMQGLRVPLAYTAGANGETNFRFESVWKVQNTNNVGTVTVAWPAGIQNLYLVQSTDDIFDNTDTFAPMTGTVTVNGVDYNTATVTLSNGEYFTLAGYAVSPGGVVDPDFWIKSDDAGDIETAWKDHSAYADDIPAVGTWALTPPDRAHNFHPYTTEYSASKLFYNNNNAAMHASTGVGDVANHSIFTAVRPISVTQGRIVGIDDDTNAAEPGMSITSAGLPNHYEFSNTTTNTSFPDPYIIGATNVFSAVADNAAGFGGGTSAFSGGEKRLGLNGTYETTTFGGSNRFQLVGKRVRVGHSGWAHGAAFPGDIMEVVWYNRTLTPNEQSRVNTYLAIKNGVTLAEDYLTASNAVVWDTTTNTGYNNNIFGVARDNTSVLHQKQAASTNLNQKLVIGHGSSLFDSNADNTNDLAEGQFLLVGDNGLKQGLSVPLAYLAGSNGETNFRFESVWKVQNTANVGTVTVAWPVGVGNMYLVRSSDDTIDATDDFIPMSTVVTVNGVDYNTATVTLNDGDFFTFAGFGYAPGGVAADLAIWHRADIGIALSGTEVSTWDDMSPNGYQVSQMGTAALPSFGAASQEFNFNPSVNFTATNQVIGQRSESTLTTNTFDIFSVLGNVSAGTTFFGIGRDNVTNSGTNWDSPHFRRNGDIIHRNSTGGNLAFRDPAPGYETVGAVTRIAYSRFNVDELNRSINGSNYGATLNLAGGNNTAWVRGGQYFGTNSGAATGMGGDDGGFTGSITEKVVYDRNLTPEERDRVNSYLAIKYGVTLRNDIPSGGNHTGTFDYLDAAGVVVWSGNANPDYHNDVIGLAREDIGLFNQRVSTSRNAVSSGRLTVATINDFVAANDDPERTEFSEDSEYILFGDNAATGETEATTDPCTGLPLDPAITRANKVWRVETTGNPEPIWLQADLNDYTFNSGIEIWVADDENFSTNLVKLPAASYAGGTASFNFLFTEGVKYMTFAGIVSPSDCDVCTGGTFVFKTGRSWNTLAERTANVMDPETIGSTDLGDLIVNMSADFPAGIEYRPNAYPRRYGRWFLSRRRDNQNVEVSHNISLNQTVAGASFQISNINTYLNNANKFTVIGYDCDDNVVMPKITNAANPSNATTYEIQGNQVIGTKRYRGLTFLHSTANVRFNRPIERIEIIFDVERVNARQTLRSLDIGDISFECAIPLPPTVDNVTMIQDFTQSEDVPSCIETTMRMRFINSNCNTRTLDISQTLPPGLEFVDDTYNDSEFGSPTPYTYDANTFTLNGLELPSGTTFLYINVRSTDGTTTVYNTATDYTVTETGNSYSSINPAAGEFSTVGFVASNFTEPDLDLLYEVDATCVDEGGQVTYTLNFDNHDPEITGASLKVYYDIGQEIVSVDFNNGTSGTLGFDPVGDSYIEIDDLVIPAGQSSITVVLDITSEIFTDEDFVSSVFELIVDPDNPCAEELPMTSNEVVLGACTCIEPPSDCDVCTGGTFVFKTGDSWNTSLERINNVMDPETIGTTDQGDLIVDMSADFPAGIEYRPDSHPRPYGRWFLSRRRDNQNVEVVHSINLNQTVAGASFQISNINTYLRNASKFTIIGYDCDDIEVLPKITNAANPSSRTTYEIQGNQVIGNKRYRGLSYLHSTANVHFERAIDRIEIVFDVERVNARQTLRSLDIGDITFECLISLPPNADNVYMVQDFANSEDVPSCLETTMRMRFVNNNCEPQTIDITQTLPSGLEFVEDTYNDSEFETPPAYTYNASTFALNGLELMPGTNYLYINVRSTDGTTTVYNTSSDYTITETSNSYSSVNPSGGEFSTIGFEASSFTAPDLNFLYEVDATCLAEGDQVTYTLNFDNQDPEITGAILKVYYDLGQDITSVTFNNGTSGVLGFDPTGESYIEIDDLVIPTGESSITVTLDITNEIFTDEDDASSFFELIVDPDNVCSVENPSMLSNVIILEACLGVDPEFCTEEVEGNTFSSDGGVPITFNQPATNYGFQFDIHALDNSFNMEINGVQLATQEIEFQSAGTSGINVQFADGDEYETNTAPIWQLKGTASAPLIRVVIAPNGDVSMYGSKTSGGELHLLELSNGNSFNAITWNDGAPNTIIATQSVVGVTYIYGRGSGLNIVPCPDTFCTQPGADGTPAEFTRVGVSDRIGMPANWPANIPNGFIAIESENKGFVITRLTTVQIDALDAVEGMLVYDTDEECIKLYNGTDWNCIVRSCND